MAKAKTALPGVRTADAEGDRYLTISPDSNSEALRALASPVRVQILQLLHDEGALKVADIGVRLTLPQSTVATNIIQLEEAGLVATRTVKGRRGHQKICSARYDEIIIRFQKTEHERHRDFAEVAMPIGLFTNCEVTAPCGLCSPSGIIGFLDMPDSFLDPARMQAGLLWFGRGFVEYKFPNNAKMLDAALDAMEINLELASEAPGSAVEWPSDISLWVNNVQIGTWTSPRDFGGRRGLLTPTWWKIESSQYGELKTWRVTNEGSELDGLPLSKVCLADLKLHEHRSIRVRIGIAVGATHPGGINIFGRGFGDTDQDIVMRLHAKRESKPSSTVVPLKQS
ncbi:MAG: helix-turn-helix domain-containing protein [Pseudomonadota bacterium]